MAALSCIFGAFFEGRQAAPKSSTKKQGPAVQERFWTPNLLNMFSKTISTYSARLAFAVAKKSRG